MFFDDRLATVLRQRTSGEAGLRTQYRQLLDLLGKNRTHGPNRREQSLIAAAWRRMDSLAEAIPADERARIIREPGWRFRSADLAAHLAEQEPEVAAAGLARAELSVDDWTALIPRLPVRARGFLRLRRDLPVDAEELLARLGVHDRGLPRPTAAEPEPAMPEPAIPKPTRARPARSQPLPGRPRDRDETGRSEISALVERIAQFRRERSESANEADIAPRLPLDELADLPERPVASFAFATDVAGRIEWASGEIAPMVIGTRIAAARAQAGHAAPANSIERAFARRQPIADTSFSLGGASAIAGDWLIDAQPDFSVEGHFTGYVGRFRRTLPDAREGSDADRQEADRIRQLLHELRTPVTAVQGYAEVIQQQLFGPAPHEYRALAAAIAADAARILAGFEELDRLARLETGALGMEPGEADLAQLIRRMLDQLAQVLEPRGAGISLRTAADAHLLAVCDSDAAEGLLWRILASLAAICGEREMLDAQLAPVIGPNGAFARLACALPARLAKETNIFAATAKPHDSAINAGLFGAGFAFRLARAEARAAGGSLEREGDRLVLTLPLLTGTEGLTGHQVAGTAG